MELVCTGLYICTESGRNTGGLAQSWTGCQSGNIYREILVREILTRESESFAVSDKNVVEGSDNPDRGDAGSAGEPAGACHRVQE